MSDSDPIVFAARVAALTDVQLRVQWSQIEDHDDLDVWQQAVTDEIVERGMNR